MKYLSSILLLAIPAIATPSPTLTERQDAGCGIASGYSFKSSAKLPDPFTSTNGTKITTKAQWPCRAQEISQLFQKYELGTLPPKPSSVTATYSAGSIKVTVSDGGKSISFSAKISTPSSGKAPYPAIIGIGGVSIPSQAGVATITFDNDGMAAQQSKSSHGTGLFFTLYGSSATAGATTAWAWGVSRLIDALELTPSANIDTTKLGVSGCSRNGKGAFIVGALEPRIALTIPQESGSGGAACWRISDSQKAAGKNIQTAGEIIGENAWFSPNFNAYATKTSDLPVDHHLLAGLIVPRGLFVIENDIDWLGPVSTTGCQEVGQMIYKSMGVPENFGFSLVGGHSHCQFPSSQASDLSAFVSKFLLGGSGSTGVVAKSSATVDTSSYIDWAAPALT
ncbi:related to extracelular cellulose binding protein (Cip2) [Phialocephala subalpina]|uniref:(4-O-methyl)-D-glucuronate--lignin esterase n=1 Tax=Phialocephala subalpina TaxID=576137 RepID=A0A1L7XV78_9HELO|nr:related to extracelular cellulose binding protein (Cip2) [Phialocephala subalpina]